MKVLGVLVGIIGLLIVGPALAAAIGTVVAAFLVTMGPVVAAVVLALLLGIAWVGTRFGTLE